ncbi:MAG TPA: Hsp20/alpha crystallin family protein [Dongiaceae bacterium]|nr:Hsp20/alpha crystallin family protein [Dongiaceae bacterium]
MAHAPEKVPVRSEKASPAPSPFWARSPFESLRTEIDRLFDDFGRFPFGFGRSGGALEPFWRSAGQGGATMPAVDVVEKENAYEISAELPGLDEKNVEVKVADDVLTISGEKKEEKEEKEKGYYRSERRFGSFQRSFELPPGVDQNKIEASFQKGVLTVTLPKSSDAQKREKKIAINAK